MSEWHVRDIFVPNPNRIHICVPHPCFLARAGRPGGQWRWGGCARWGAWQPPWWGAKFSIFQFSCSMPQKLDTGSDNYGKTNRTSRSGGFAEFRPIPGRLGGPDGVGDALVQCPTQWYTGRCVAVRANTARGCPQAPLTAEKPPSYSPAAHRRPTHSRRPAYTTKLRGSRRITRKRTSCPRDGPQPSSAAACEAGRAVLGLTPRSSR